MSSATWGATLCFVVGIAPAAAASPQGGLFRGGSAGRQLATPPSSSPFAQRSDVGVRRSRDGRPQPGGGPEIPFAEDRWEFWWEFHHDDHLRLRPHLAELAADLPGASFEPVGTDERRSRMLPSLVAALADEDPLVRSAAAHALSRLEDPSVVAPLARAASGDLSRTVRHDALLALGHSRAPQAARILEAVLASDEEGDETRALAAAALGHLATPAASRALRAALDAKDGVTLSANVRLAALHALGLTEDLDHEAFVLDLLHTRRQDDRTRALAAEVLGRIGSRDALPHLVSALGDSKTHVRRAAAIALGAIAMPDDRAAIRALDRAARRDSDTMVRNFADLTLGRVAARGASELVETLESRLRKVSSRRQGFVALALGLTEDASAGTALRKMMRKERSHSLRGACAVALSMLHAYEAVGELRDAFEDSNDPALRGYVSYALGRLGDDTMREELRAQLASTKSPELLRWTSFGLACLGDPTLHDQLVSRAAEGGDAVMRSTAAVALGWTGDRRALGILETLARDPDTVSHVRAYATLAQGLLCETRASAAPARTAQHHNYTLGLAYVPSLYFAY